MAIPLAWQGFGHTFGLRRQTQNVGSHVGISIVGKGRLLPCKKAPARPANIGEVSLYAAGIFYASKIPRRFRGDRAEYGKRLIERLSCDLTNRFGRGFGYVNLTQMRRFYLAWPAPRILQTVSEESSPTANLQTLSEQSHVTIRQTATGKPIIPTLTKHNRRKPDDAVSLEEQIKDPFVLEFLGLKDEYSEIDKTRRLLESRRSASKSHRSATSPFAGRRSKSSR
jgi:DUF1016 N-terminal domain